MSENKGLFAAVFLSIFVLVVWKAYFEREFLPQNNDRFAHVKEEGDSNLVGRKRESFVSASEVIHGNESHRVFLENSKIKGSVNLQGAIFDDLLLEEYHVSTNSTEDKVRVFSPASTEGEYTSQFGWKSSDAEIVVPSGESKWAVDHNVSAGKSAIGLLWDNGRGMLFKLAVNLDEGYLFKVSQSVINNTSDPITITPRIVLLRRYEDFDKTNFILHQGPVGTSSGSLFELDYKDLIGEAKPQYYQVLDKDWVGFSDKYWASIIIGQGASTVGSAVISHYKAGMVSDMFRIELDRAPVVVSPGSEVKVMNYLFAGAKELKAIDQYSKDLNVYRFDRVVDFGRLYFFTKPVFLLLQYFNGLTHSFGLAILLLTIVVKILVFPLSYRSYASMFKMRALQPEITKLKEDHEHDKVKLQQKTLALFKKHGVNPAAGCLPTLLQIPVFFSLYKVIFITLEMRHAPFLGWIKDLSAPDPSSILTLFGLLDLSIPAFLDIGILPIILGFTMFLQQKLNSAGKTVDPAQENVLKLMPYIFTFLFASFPAGLIIYWIWNNILSVIQQVFVSRFLLRRKSG